MANHLWKGIRISPAEVQAMSPEHQEALRQWIRDNLDILPARVASLYVDTPGIIIILNDEVATTLAKPHPVADLPFDITSLAAVPLDEVTANSLDPDG